MEHLKETREKFFINLIKEEINLCLDIGGIVGEYTKRLLFDIHSKVISFKTLLKAFDELKKIKSNFQNLLKINNVTIGIKDEA